MPYALCPMPAYQACTALLLRKAIPVFNSNSPELVREEGILLSTFPPNRKRFPTAHLNPPFQGRFDLFVPPIAKAAVPENLRTLYQGFMVYNPGDRPVKLDLLQAASQTSQNQTVTVGIQTPIKTDELMTGGLTFLEPSAPQTFFRGTVRLRYNDDSKFPQSRYIHLVQRRGQPGEPLVKLEMKAGETRLVEVDFSEPPDASPPQVLTVKKKET